MRLESAWEEPEDRWRDDHCHLSTISLIYPASSKHHRLQRMGCPSAEPVEEELHSWKSLSQESSRPLPKITFIIASGMIKSSNIQALHFQFLLHQRKFSKLLNEQIPFWITLFLHSHQQLCVLHEHGERWSFSSLLGWKQKSSRVTSSVPKSTEGVTS